MGEAIGPRTDERPVPSGQEVTLPGARLYLLDETDKIASEQVIFYLGGG
jgi:hypothetical protein